MRWKLAGVFLGTAACAGLAVGSAVYTNLKLVPNLDNVPGTSSACQVCHISSQGGTLNPFGETVRSNLDANRRPDWSAIWNFDSDHDGFTNGHELGDPSGQWTPGTADPGTPSLITHPGNPASKPANPSSVQGIRTPAAWAVIKALFR